MAHSAPARSDLDGALDEGLQALFRGLLAAPAPQMLLGLIEELEAAYGRAGRVDGEARAFAPTA